MKNIIFQDSNVAIRLKILNEYLVSHQFRSGSICTLLASSRGITVYSVGCYTLLLPIYA